MNFNYLPYSILVTVALGLSSNQLVSAIEKNKTDNNRPNVLFIIVDDMNDWVGVFGGNPQAKTPNIDHFAKKSIVFRSAYCSAPLCNPSRTSILTGYLPSTTGVYDNNTYFRERKGFEITVTLPQYFKQNGYNTVGAGKLFHNQRGPNIEPRKMSDPGSFEMERVGNIGVASPPKEKQYQHGLDLDRPGVSPHYLYSFDWAGVDQPTEETDDWKSADYCAQFLQQEHEKPFFMACGIFRPHLIWYAPQKYFDMYPIEEIIVPKILETDLDDVGATGQLWAAPEMHKEIVRKGKWKEAVRAYMACLSYADDCVGHLLNALENSDYNDNTIVIIMGDHGWHLGEKLHWEKNTLWEEAAKAPLIIYDPIHGSKGFCKRIVSFIDIYPTLVDLCSLPKKADIEGVSLKRLLVNPDASWNRSALTTRGKGNHSLRNENYSYIHYNDGFEELYDHRIDPMEWKNLAKESEMGKTIEAFRKELFSRVKQELNDD